MCVFDIVVHLSLHICSLHLLDICIINVVNLWNTEIRETIHTHTYTSLLQSSSCTTDKLVGIPQKNINDVVLVTASKAYSSNKNSFLPRGALTMYEVGFWTILWS